MALNVVSNYAANVAHRNLTASDNQMTSSLAKLSSGSRVVSAKDDAAAMAIGSRISSEVAALKQANVNAGQASSMLQIADGAMSNVNDILTRMKTLGVQASSGQISNTEREMLDTEYQSLVKEIDRIASDTEFNGNSLVSGTTGHDDLWADDFGTATIVGDRTFEFTYDGTTLTAQEKVLDADGTTWNDGDSTLTFDVDAADASTVAGKTIDLGDGVRFEFSKDFDGTAVASNAEDQYATGQAETTASFTFKLGTGTLKDIDTVTFSIGSITSKALGVDGTSISTADGANAALTKIGNAINDLNTSRATVGASQNRLEFASSNLATTIENQEAARSALLDLDVAAEMTNFTSKQILMQAGVSMLAQANQMPQQLTRLFG